MAKHTWHKTVSVSKRELQTIINAMVMEVSL